MWFNDIDIRLRQPDTTPRPDGVAPLRHRAAFLRYLERNARRQAELRQHRMHTGFGMMESWIDILAPRFRRPPAVGRPSAWRDVLLRFPYR